MRCFELRDNLKEPNLLRQIDDIRELVKQTIQDTRTLTFELSPPVLYELGLVAAIDWLAEQFQLKHGLKIKVQKKILKWLLNMIQCLLSLILILLMYMKD